MSTQIAVPPPLMPAGEQAANGVIVVDVRELRVTSFVLRAWLKLRPSCLLPAAVCFLTSALPTPDSRFSQRQMMPPANRFRPGILRLAERRSPTFADGQVAVHDAVAVRWRI